MLIFKLKSQISEKVTIILKLLRNLIHWNIYKNLFQIILTDNDHEFKVLLSKILYKKIVI